MLGDPLKRSQLFTAIWVGLLFLYCCQIAHLSSASANDSVSKKRRFIKAFLQAEKGDPEAQYTVGMILAIVWFTKAAEQDYSQAQYFLSLMYGLGDGVTQSDRKAADWAQKAAEQGHADAQYSLGRMYSTGQGLSPDDARAVEWLLKAAEQGHLDAQCDLGMMYQSGRGVKRNMNHAIQWWVKASQ
ncbi:MAG: tetratricopeptide repeat protein, partial [Planctomycetota bacterium]